jgi:uncharacterized repeat protein (TIGR03803 family)
MITVSVALISGLIGSAFVQPALAAQGGKAVEKVLHSFGSGADGRNPYATVTDVEGVLYGTTVKGGSASNGTVFSTDPKTDAETVLYSFCSQQNCTDGSEPFGNLITVKGTLYGTTFVGGTTDSGTVFAFDPKTGTETVLYSFCSRQNCVDGFEPLDGLVAAKGGLYGTTTAGGSHNYGTLFALDPDTGAEQVLHSFGSGTDGYTPEAGLTDVMSTLYGTTYTGGASGNGVAFAFDLKTGAESVIYSFCSRQNCTDGSEPFAGLDAAEDTLYGMAANGGANDYGAVFAIDLKTGAETVLYSFCNRQNCTDGEGSDAGLIDVKGILYGTTYSGGASGQGTVFAVKP